jgi:hypothetical protein
MRFPELSRRLPMMKVESFFSGGPIILEGSVVKKDDKKLSIQIHPGLVVEILTKQIERLEEATDPVTARNFIRVSVSADANISAVFQPKLARLALGSGAQGVPFTFGGDVPTETLPVIQARMPGGGDVWPWQPTKISRRTWCDGAMWGWICDDLQSFEINDHPH